MTVRLHSYSRCWQRSGEGEWLYATSNMTALFRACSWQEYKPINTHNWTQASHFYISLSKNSSTVLMHFGNSFESGCYLLSCPLSLFLSCWSLYSRCCFSSSCSWRCCSIFLWCSKSSCWCLSASKSCWCWWRERQDYWRKKKYRETVGKGHYIGWAKNNDVVLTRCSHGLL